MLFKPSVITLTTLALTFIPIILIIYEKRKFKLSKIIKKDDSRYKCIFITQENYGCNEHVYNSISCGDTCSYNYLQIIINLLRTATSSISMCVYHITLESIRDELLEAKSRNVHVRIVTDREMEFNAGSKVPQLRDAGIEVKTQSSKEKTGFLHHKFCLMDESRSSQIMWFGSLNLTMQGLCSNWDNVVITDNTEIISRFSDAFETLWTIL